MAEFDVRGELLIGGEWVDATGELLTRQALTHTRGRQDQASRVDPSTCRPLLDNTNGQFSPDNPTGPYYGKFGRNTPFRLSVRAGTPALELDGTADTATTPDTAALDITGDLDLRWEGEADWYATGPQFLIGKWGGATGTLSYVLRIQAGGLYMHFSVDGAGGVWGWRPLPTLPRRAALRGTLDVDNGAGGWTARLYWAETLAGPWRQIGEDVVTTAGPVTIFSGPAPLSIAPQQLATTPQRRAVTGRCYRAEVRSGINGTVVAAPDFTAHAAGTTSFTDSAGRLWTMSSAEAVTDRRTRLAHELAAYPTRWHPSGAHAWVEATTAGVLRRLRRGSTALDSTLRRRIPSYAPLAYWPLEEGQHATRAYSPLPGVGPLRLTNVSWASADSLASSRPLPTLNTSTGNLAHMSGTVPSASAGGLPEWSVEWVYRLDQAPASVWTFMRVLSTGTVREWYLQSGNNTSRVVGKDSEGNEIFSQPIGTSNDIYGLWVKVRFQVVQQSAGTVRWRIDWSDVGGDAGGYETTFTGTAGRPVGVASPPGGFAQELNGMAIGHIAVFDTAVSPAFDRALDAWTGETAGERMQRLASEETYPVIVHGAAADQERVGPQLPSPVLDLLEEAADADGGILYEDRERLRLIYRSRATMYSQRPVLVLDYTEPGLAPPLEPTGDDDGTENDVTVTRANGSSGRAVLEEGPLSVQAPPAGVGPYPSQVTLNLHSDEQTEPHAYWRLHHGTYEGRRYPQVRVKVHTAPPELLDQILAVDVGDKMIIRNPPVWVAPGDIELIVQGYEETFSSPYEWDIVFTCTPGEPWNVGAVNDPVYGRADTDGSALAAAVDADDTALMVQATDGPVWVTTATYPGEFPFDVRAGGEVMTVTAIADAAADAFQRTVAGGWGTADTGQAWTTSGGPATDYAVGAGVGTHTMTSTNLSRRSLLAQPSADFDLMVDVATSVLSTGGFQSGGLIARAVDSNNLVQARLEFTTSQTIVLTLRKRLAGAETVLGTYTLPLTHTAGTYYRLRFQGQGSALRTRAWRVGTEDPVTWQVTATDTALAAAAEMGVRSILSSANTNASPVVRYDSFRLLNPQRFTVTRSGNGVVKAHTAGTDVRLATPTIVTL
ncbi:hypothetical protein [Streptomyces sp. enrichment culture]|uniref:hypothetical protein n=1 Tax=Streptomyces sp. enrichment culture TaxID=1795815 RepID=UPI003F567113